jgi:putative IMPACT (imprinted ancient) family translation regulator
MYDFSWVTECDTDHYLVVAKVRKTLAVSKRATLNFDVDIFNLRKLWKLEITKQYQLKISNRFAALEYLSDSEDISRALEHIKENIKISAKNLSWYEMKQRKPCLIKDVNDF